LVPGDVVQLEEGDRISADTRLIAAESFYVDISVLTGESLPVTRHANPIQTADGHPQQGSVSPPEMANLVFAGSTVASGRGMGVVYATGTRTEFGQVARLTASISAAK
jgi:Ca2+-transporting ATPase